MKTRRELWKWAHVTTVLVATLCASMSAQTAEPTPMLRPECFRHYFNGFVRDEQQMLGSAPGYRGNGSSGISHGWILRMRE